MQILKNQVQIDRRTVSYKCELRAMPSLALLALLLSVCRSFKALYWQRSVLCSAVHVVVQCSGVEYTAETVEGLKYAGEGQVCSNQKLFWCNIFYFFVDHIGEGPGGGNCPLHLPSQPRFRRPCWVYYTVLSLHSLVTWLPSPSYSLLPCHYSLGLELSFVQNLWELFYPNRWNVF